MVLVTSKKFNIYERKLSVKDLEEVHKIRGRLLHFSTILELMLKETISREIYDKFKGDFLNNKNGDMTSYKDLSFYQRIELFKRHINSKKLKSRSSFIKNLNDIRDRRNEWAHGVVFYRKFKETKQDDNLIPLNFIRDFDKGKDIAIHNDSNYFRDANKSFDSAFKWLKKERFLEKFKNHYLY